MFQPVPDRIKYRHKSEDVLINKTAFYEPQTNG